MAEGPEVHRIADRLQRELFGQRVHRLVLPPPMRPRLGRRARRLSGARIRRATARGKFLLLEFSTGDVLLHHMRVWGHWTFTSPGRRAHAERPRRRLRVELVTAKRRATLWDAPVVELLSREELRAHPILTAQGPDGLVRPFNWREFLRRLAAPRRAPQAIGKVLLDQRVVAGVGNMYKAEILFLCRIHPRTPVRALTTGERRCLTRTIPKVLWQAYRHPVWYVAAARRAAGTGRKLLQIYGRAGQPCPRCGASIRRFPQGGPKRPAFYCPRCQLRPRRT